MLLFVNVAAVIVSVAVVIVTHSWLRRVGVGFKWEEMVHQHHG